MEYKSPSQYPNQIILKETKYWYITLWTNQYYLGRASIELKESSKRHISQLTNDEILELFSLIRSYEKTLIKVLNTTNFNWACLMNDSYKEKNIEKQYPLHWHVYPRYRDGIEFNGESFKDEVFAHHYDKYKEKIVDREFLIKLADEISNNWEM